MASPWHANSPGSLSPITRGNFFGLEAILLMNSRTPLFSGRLHIVVPFALRTKTQRSRPGGCDTAEIEAGGAGQISRAPRGPVADLGQLMACGEVLWRFRALVDAAGTSLRCRGRRRGEGVFVVLTQSRYHW